GRDRVFEAFRKAVSKQGGVIEGREDDGRIRVSARGRLALVYLDNLRRRIEAGEPLGEAATTFARALMGPEAEPSEQDRRRGLRLQLERRDVIAGTDSVHHEISRELVLSLVWTDDEERSIRFLTDETLGAWAIEPKRAWTEAGKQMDALLK